MIKQMKTKQSIIQSGRIFQIIHSNNTRSWIWKKNALLNLINNQPAIDKIYLYTKDPYQSKYQFLTNKRESTGLKHFNLFFYLDFFSGTFTDHRTSMQGSGHFFNSSLPLPPASQKLRHQSGDYCRELTFAHNTLMIQNLLSSIQMVCKMFTKILKITIQVKKCKVLTVFDDMIADMINNEKLNSRVTELFIRGKKLNISIVFITQSYFEVPKDVRINLTHFFIMKIPNKRELQQIALNH